MSELKRIQVGEFNIFEAITLEELENDLQNVNSNLITIEQLFDKNNNIYLEDRKIKHFLNGVQLTMHEADGIYKIYNNNKFIGTGSIKNNFLKRDIII